MGGSLTVLRRVWPEYGGRGGCVCRPAARGAGVRDRVGDHGGTEPGRHGGAADSGGDRRRRAGGRPPETARLRLHPPAAQRLGRPCTRLQRTGHVEREVIIAAEDADLLILARDGDRYHRGPKSLGTASRFVVDHAPSPVVLVWPATPPCAGAMPPPPPPPRPH